MKARQPQRHTPGPWALLPDPKGWTLSANGQDITSEAFDCTDADALLISYAPSMKRVLEQAWATLTDWKPEQRAAYGLEVAYTEICAILDLVEAE